MKVLIDAVTAEVVLGRTFPELPTNQAQTELE